MTLQDMLSPRLGQALRPNVWDVVALVLVIGAMVLIVYAPRSSSAHAAIISLMRNREAGMTPFPFIQRQLSLSSKQISRSGNNCSTEEATSPTRSEKSA